MFIATIYMFMDNTDKNLSLQSVMKEVVVSKWRIMAVYSVIVLYLFYYISHKDFETGQVVIMFGVMPLFLYISYLMHISKKIFWKKLAEKYNWSISESHPTPSSQALIFKVRTYRSKCLAVTGVHNEAPFRYVNYTYKEGKHVRHMTVTTFSFKGSLPHIYLSYINDTYFHPWLPMLRFPKLSISPLTNKKFTLYAPKEYEIETFQIFTPEVIEFLLQDEWKCDFELVEGELIIYQQQHFTDEEKVISEIEKMTNFYKLLSARLDSMRLYKIGDRTTQL